MTDSQRLADRAWKDAEALLERVERSANSGDPPLAFYNDLVEGLRLTSGAASIVLESRDRQRRETLARVGMTIHDDAAVLVPSDAEDEAICHWIGEDTQLGDRLVVSRSVHAAARLSLDLRFDQVVKLDLREPLGELAQVLLDLAAVVYLRSQVDRLGDRLDAQDHRDALLGRLYRGATLGESFAAIASTIAAERTVDRVSLLRFQAKRWKLIATSTQAKLDRRARQVRLLEQLTEQSLNRAASDSFVLGEGRGQLSPSLEAYLNESGCREIYLETIRDEESQTILAAIVLERFRTAADEMSAISSVLDPLRDPLRGAVRNAVARDDGWWSVLVNRLADRWDRPRTWLLAALSAGLAVAACLVPAPLKLPVEGRIMAAQMSHIYAPAAGIVNEVMVRNGQPVRVGEPLLVVHSPSLDLKQRAIEGELATAQTRLASLSALRSGGREVSVVAEEQVLRTEIEGLRAQLDLLQTERSTLTVRSPIDGKVDGWDLGQSLTARPVSHGQFLFEVVSTGQGWTVELDVPDQEIGYLLDAQREGTPRCTFRLRSNATKTYQAEVDHVAEVAHLDPRGQSVVRVTCSLKSARPDELRYGATVIGQLDCGDHAIGFVWLRGIIQWWRLQGWF